MNGQDAQVARPSSEPTLEVMMQNGNSTRDTITDIEQVLTSIEDFLDGPRPEKEMGGNVEGCAAGMLAAICQVTSNNHDRLMQVHRRVSSLANKLGTQR